MTDAERLEFIKENAMFGIGLRTVAKQDFEWLIEQVERVQGLEKEKEFFRRSLVDVKANENVLEKENKRLREALRLLKTHSIHCDADNRAIQPYEIIDLINEFTEQSK